MSDPLELFHALVGEDDDTPEWLNREYPSCPIEECARIFLEEVAKDPKVLGETPIDCMARSHRISVRVVQRVHRWKPN